MNSQVSFKFDGEHNKKLIVKLLKQRLNGLRYKIEKQNRYIYRIYVTSLEDRQKTFSVCFGIQSNAVYDFNRILTSRNHDTERNSTTNRRIQQGRKRKPLPQQFSPTFVQFGQEA